MVDARFAWEAGLIVQKSQIRPFPPWLPLALNTSRFRNAMTALGKMAGLGPLQAVHIRKIGGIATDA